MSHRRSAFTLVEILVSMALTIFLLTILAQAFVLGADTFRTLKAVGDLNDNLRTAANMLRADLGADHFEGKRRLSDPRFWTDGPPLQGYFFLYAPQFPPPFLVSEGVDADGLPCSRNTGPTILAFTVKAKGNRPQDFFSIGAPAAVPALANWPNAYARFQQTGTLSGQWSEVCYFLAPVTTATANGTPLFALYRQQRLVVSDIDQNFNVDQLNWGFLKVANPAAPVPTPYLLTKDKVSCQPNPNVTFQSFLYFNSPADLTIPERRTACAFKYPAIPLPPAPLIDLTLPGTPPTGEDLLLQDVLSFDVKVLLSPGTDFQPMAGYFDSWSRRHDDRYDYSSQAIPLTANIYALQITLRIWSPGAKVARQITIVQDM